MLGELSGVAGVYIITGRTDMRRSIDGLMAIIRDTYEMYPYANALFLICGRKKNTVKALHFDKDGFVLYLKRLYTGRFQWPKDKDASEVRPLTRQEFRWLMEGLSIEQPKAIRPITQKKDF
ncbi:IS66 family insertion sequence element accessory protein TnpB [Lacrimispora sp. 38-1]|uniref:IS66 family insertion sequence element accessory protein TnpB n=1 Tax=Lacrimispora sp. 38-1 TaxID=3125778 RepID=UPI003CF9F776